MALDLVLDNLDGVSDDLKPHYELNSDLGKFVLQGNEYSDDNGNSFGVINAAGLKSALQKERASNKDLNSQLNGLKAFSDLGLTVEQIGDLQTKAGSVDADKEALTNSLNSQWQEKYSTLEAKMNETIGNFHKANHDKALTDIIVKNKGDIVDNDGAVNYFKGVLAGMTKTDDSGNVMAVDALGNPLMTKKAGSADPMGLQELWDIVKSDPTHQFAMRASGASGSGSTGSTSGNGGNSVTTDPTDGASFNALTNDQRIAFYQKNPTEAGRLAKLAAKLQK